ncbi:hypothetical protein EZS27_004086 [termite gut metagenome]|uniref:Uncharacterized protein n=1 Tax=termite gut metagenome TaxID=433724 RepID=A0A5J4SQX4_9ZZZZ
MQAIKLEQIGDQVKVTCPYNEEFVRKAHNLRGKWKENAWWFDDSILEYVREVMIQIYNTTGEVPYDNCTLVITDFSGDEMMDPVNLFGRTIAEASGRDSGARLGEDIIFIKGRYTSGGSVKNWRTVVSNAMFEIQNFPMPSLELPDVKKAIEEGWCKVKEAKKKRSRDDIQKEIEALSLRISELEKELNA